MTDPTTPTTACTCLAAPDRHVPMGSVALPLSPLGPHRSASTIHAHAAARIMGSII
jgi:hypothetical protein